MHMSHENRSHDSPITRRRALAAGATLLTAGGTLVWVGEPASAQVSVESFSVADASFESESIDPVVDVTAAYRYDVAERPVDHLWFGVAIDGDTVAEETLVTETSTLENTTQLSARVADASGWSLTDFAPDAGGSVEHEVAIALSFAVRERDDSTIAQASAQDSATIAVTNPNSGNPTAALGGEGVIRDSSQ